MLPCIWYDFEYPFWLLLTFRNTSKKLRSRPIFPRQHVRSNQANCTEWCILYHVQNPQVCRGIGSRRRIGSIIYQLQRRQNYATNFTRNGPSATGHSHTLWQLDGSRNCKWYYQETTFLIDGNEIFLGHRSGQNRRCGSTVASRTRKCFWLYKQAPW